jgi:hypothetical protein
MTTSLRGLHGQADGQEADGEDAEDAHGDEGGADTADGACAHTTAFLRPPALPTLQRPQQRTPTCEASSRRPPATHATVCRAFG